MPNNPRTIREENFNAILAILLQDQADIPGIAEARQHSRAGYPDITVKPTRSATRRIIIEAKKGTNQNCKRQAVKQAARRFRGRQRANIYAAFGLCYPAEINNVSNQAEVRKYLAETDRLQFSQVYADGKFSRWCTGSVENLANSIRAAESGHTAITQEMKEAIEASASILSVIPTAPKRIARTLNLPPPPHIW